MKEKTFILLAILMVFLCSHSSAFAAKISVPDTNADAGETINVPVNVE